jgi:hypothetical protein
MAAAALVVGTIAAVHYARLDLTLSHYDTRGHLIVARRIFDNLTPGWRQIGAIWLPLPHLLNAIPVQIDALYRSGASAVVLSVIAFAVAVGATTSLVASLTGSTAAAILAAAVFALDPNVLYLQATPMTEPLLFGLTALGVALLVDWCRAADAGEGGARARSASPRTVGTVFALACLTRYEAWPVTYAAVAFAGWVCWRNGAPPAVAIRRVAPVALPPTLAIAGFTVFSRIVIGRWFAGGFYVPDNRALGKPLAAAGQVGWGLLQLSDPVLLAMAAAGALVLLAPLASRRLRAERVIALSLGAAAALPWFAFVNGHPFRIRYMVPLLLGEAVAVGAAVGLLQTLAAAGVRRWGRTGAGRAFAVRAAVAAVVALAIVPRLDPFDLRAPMIVEAQRDRPNRSIRAQVTRCLQAGYEGETVMASMSSLGAYMQETAHAGFDLRDFLHEGNGALWSAALEEPRPFVGWILIEEKAEGGDMLAQRARGRPAFLDGFTRVCEGAGLALYRRLGK